eukprot:654012-Pleurochrysis_carterae.AAC.1
MREGARWSREARGVKVRLWPRRGEATMSGERCMTALGTTAANRCRETCWLQNAHSVKSRGSAEAVEYAKRAWMQIHSSLEKWMAPCLST